jgi:predicted regulator of Ras-like GTPase activity (Roadblock/LC7/MglB family)
MLNFFKNLFGSGGAETHSNGNGNGNGNGYAATATAAPTAPVQVRARTVVPQKPAASVAARPTPPARPMATHAAPVAAGTGINLPLYTVIAVLPLELKTRIRETMVADIQITISLEQVLMQLGTGVVKITYGELRAMVPDVFTSQTDLDATEIPLPLNEILPQINPAMIARRQSQKHLQVPEDIHGPFGKDLAGVSVADPRTTKPVAPTPAAVKLSPPPMPPTPPARPMPPVVPQARPVTPAKPAPAAVVPPLKPAAPIQFNAPKAPAPAPAPENDPIPMIPFRSSITSTPTPRPPTATPSASPPVRPSLPSSRGVGATPLPSAASRLPAAPSNGGARPAAPRPAQAVPAASAAQDVFLSVPLTTLSESWPEVLRGEIEQLNLAEAHLALPVRFIEPALKQGKIAFTWKVLRSWIRPATLPTVSAHDGMVLELPLRIIAPLFLARQKKGQQPNQKVEVNESIPNLFFGFPQADSAAAVVEQPAPAPAPVLAPAPQEINEPEANFAPTARANGAGDTNFYVWNEATDAPQVDESDVKKPSPGTDFLTRYATPNEVVSRAAALDGVAGALVALPDGLMVASKLSADLNGDTLAAFLPHIFGKVSQCTKELRMGELNNLHFTVGNVPWKIFRVNAIFFAAFGHAGQPLPTAQLAALAGELDRKK